MSARLQIILADAELAEIRAAAAGAGTTVSEWVRQTLRRARLEAGSGDVDAKLATVRAGARYAFPAPDIDQMMAEIERGYEQ